MLIVQLCSSLPARLIELKCRTSTGTHQIKITFKRLFIIQECYIPQPCANLSLVCAPSVDLQSVNLSIGVFSLSPKSFVAQLACVGQLSMPCYVGFFQTSLPINILLVLMLPGMFINSMTGHWCLLHQQCKRFQGEDNLDQGPINRAKPLKSFGGRPSTFSGHWWHVCLARSHWFEPLTQQL